MSDREGKEKQAIVPGELRRREVEVGSHIPPTAAALEEFLGNTRRSTHLKDFHK